MYFLTCIVCIFWLGHWADKARMDIKELQEKVEELEKEKEDGN